MFAVLRQVNQHFFSAAVFICIEATKSVFFHNEKYIYLNISYMCHWV